MVTLNNTSLALPLSLFLNAQRAEFHYLWLRDNCHCEHCHHPDTGERISVTADIAADLCVKEANLEEEGLSIRWGDEHQSYFSIEWLRQHNYSARVFKDDPAKGNGIHPWGHELQDSIPIFDYDHLYQSEQRLLEWCCAVRDIGLTIIRNAPTIEGEIERFAEHVACVRETIYDRLHNVRATPSEYNAYNVASTTLELKPHTDMPNYNNPPGVQMFHFLVNESLGGESTAVDGAMVAKQLKEQDRQAYELLTRVPVSFRMASARGDIVNANPVLTLDGSGELKVFRFSNQLAQTANMSANLMPEFYRAYQLLGKLVEAPENKVQFRLNTGDIMVTNNLRVMHGRNAYDPSSGDRHLQLSYMDFDDLLSRIRMLLKSPL